jgi:hypothetical protein
MPRTIAPRTACPLESIACACTKGALASTCSCCAASLAIDGQSESRLPAPLICTCEATPRMRVRTSFWKPFITESTTISAHTPTAMPIIDTRELMLMKRFRRRARK